MVLRRCDILYPQPQGVLRACDRRGKCCAAPTSLQHCIHKTRDRTSSLRCAHAARNLSEEGCGNRGAEIKCYVEPVRKRNHMSNRRWKTVETMQPRCARAAVTC